MVQNLMMAKVISRQNMRPVDVPGASDPRLVTL